MKGWQGVGEWFNGVTKWFNEIDIGIKIGVGLLVFAAACALVIMSAPTGGTTLAGAIAAYTGMSNTIAAATVAGMAITYAVGIASATAMSAAGALLSGGDVVEAMTNATADAIFWGGVFAFISAGINALKTVARTTYNAKLPGSSQTGAQPQSTVNQCFKEGTLVETEEGLKPIEEIAVGDKVLAYDEATGEQAYKPVVQLFRNTTKEWYHIHVNGEEIICTGGHPFYILNAENDRNIVNFEGQPQNTKGAWICANELKVSDKVLLSDGTTAIIEVIEVEHLSDIETTYNFEVTDFHTYYVSDSKVLVHNSCRSTQRKNYWKNRANDADALELYGENNIKLMKEGKSPIINGEKIELHHVLGFKNEPNLIVEVTHSNHIKYHKLFGYKPENFINNPITQTSIPIFYGG